MSLSLFESPALIIGDLVDDETKLPILSFSAIFATIPARQLLSLNISFCFYPSRFALLFQSMAHSFLFEKEKAFPFAITSTLDFIFSRVQKSFRLFFCHASFWIQLESFFFPWDVDGCPLWHDAAWPIRGDHLSGDPHSNTSNYVPKDYL